MPSPSMRQERITPFVARPRNITDAKYRWTIRCAVALGASALWSCSDVPVAPVAAPHAPNLQMQTVPSTDVLASTRWNERATDLLQGLPDKVPANGQAWASRMLTYLSLAQYRAALRATLPSNHQARPSVSAAVSSASFDVIQSFFATESSVPNANKAIISAQLDQWRSEDAALLLSSGAPIQDVAAGEAIGHTAGAAVLTQAHSDGYLTAAVPFGAMIIARGLRETDWRSAPGASPARSLWGVTPFFLKPADLVQSPIPPGYDSREFKRDLAEVYAISSTRTADQTAIANKWNKVSPLGPYTAGEWNRRADGLIRSHHRSELPATLILAYANAAAFDAQIDCFVTKYTYWVRRPAQVDSRISTVFATPNHPSYPSGHSCISSAFGAVLTIAFPSERQALNAEVEEAGLSRLYAGIHYRVDITVGQGVGRRAAAKALRGGLE